MLLYSELMGNILIGSWIIWFEFPISRITQKAWLRLEAGLFVYSQLVLDIWVVIIFEPMLIQLSVDDDLVVI
jgi:hypothetical protein